MAKKSPPNLLPPNTMIELVAIKGNKAVKKEMEYQKALEQKTEFETNPKWKGWSFRLFQMGFSSFNNQ